MMKSFIERENEILSILEAFNKANLKYVLVGGYAVSAYMHRFSVDADVCISKNDLPSFKEVLKAKHFELEKRRDLEDMYNGEFECYIKKEKLPVTVDLMIGSIASRQTGASISFNHLFENSSIKEITGIEKTISARIPSKEALISLKIHAARLTDARDIAALCHSIDFDVISKFVNIGDLKKVQNNIKMLDSYFKSKNFKDSFKGVFSIEKLPAENIDSAVSLLNKLNGQFKF